MKTIGIIGGIAPASTIEYYRLLISLYRENEQDGNYPSIIINSINLKEMIRLIETNRLEEATEIIVKEINKLKKAGAEIGFMASNTPHIIFDEIQSKSPMHLISIVEATCEKAQKMNLKKVGLFGTKFTMQADAYPKVFSKSGIEIFLPPEKDLEFIHKKYMSEFINEIFLPETREELMKIIKRLKKENEIEGLILGGTELPLILTNQEEAEIPFLDTTRIHAEAVISKVFE